MLRQNITQRVFLSTMLRWCGKEPMASSQSQSQLESSENEYEYEINCQFCFGKCKCPSDPTELNQWMSRDMDYDIHRYMYEDMDDDYSSVDSTVDRARYHEKDLHKKNEWQRDFHECLFYQQELIYKSLFDIISANDYTEEMKTCLLNISWYEEMEGYKKKWQHKIQDEICKENMGYWQEEQSKMEMEG